MGASGPFLAQRLPGSGFFVGSGVYTVTLVLNVLGLILGFLMLFRPIFTLTVLQTFAGAYLILLGVDAIVMAVSRMGSRW